MAAPDPRPETRAAIRSTVDALIESGLLQIVPVSTATPAPGRDAPERIATR